MTNSWTADVEWSTSMGADEDLIDAWVDALASYGVAIGGGGDGGWSATLTVAESTLRQAATAAIRLVEAATSCKVHAISIMPTEEFDRRVQQPLILSSWATRRSLSSPASRGSGPATHRPFTFRTETPSRWRPRAVTRTTRTASAASTAAGRLRAGRYVALAFVGGRQQLRLPAAPRAHRRTHCASPVGLAAHLSAPGAARAPCADARPPRPTPPEGADELVHKLQKDLIDARGVWEPLRYQVGVGMGWYYLAHNVEELRGHLLGGYTDAAL